MSHRIEVVADADAALGTGLERRRPASAEGIEDDITGPAVARDEGMRQRCREHREVAAHGVEGVAPEALLHLPLGLDVEPRQRRQEAGIELAGGDPLRGGHGRASDLVLACATMG